MLLSLAFVRISVASLSSYYVFSVVLDDIQMLLSLEYEWLLAIDLCEAAIQFLDVAKVDRFGCRLQKPFRSEASIRRQIYTLETLVCNPNA